MVAVTPLGYKCAANQIITIQYIKEIFSHG